jgi:flagellar basal body P-ring protein FlgI
MQFSIIGGIFAALAGLLALALAEFSVAAERIKDLASVQGVRNNQLVGYGLVVGLDGSGDQTTQTPFTTQSIINMLAQLGTTLPTTQSLQLKNVAAVMVTANLPPFARIGQQIDVTVSSMGNAKSLRGGTLVMTPLKGADGQIYAQAQGNLLVGGVGAGSGGSKVTINHLLAGRIVGGATVEREVPTALGQGPFVHYEMRTTDFGTTQRVVEVINRAIGPGTAQALDGRRDAGDRPRRREQSGRFPGASRESRSTADQRNRQGDHQPAHRLGGDEPDGDHRILRRRARQSFGDHQYRAASQPAQCAVGRTDGDDDAERDRHQAGGRVA